MGKCNVAGSQYRGNNNDNGTSFTYMLSFRDANAGDLYWRVSEKCAQIGGLQGIRELCIN